MSHERDFAFAFNDIGFSDRVLNIEIFPDDKLTSHMQPQSNDLNSASTATEASVNNSNNDGYQVREENGVRDMMIEENNIRLYQRKNETKIGDDSSRSEDDSRIIKSKKFHVCSVVLAAYSPFFHKLFTNGMMESEQKCVTLGIHANEETAFMELLNFMYNNGTLKATTVRDLLDVLKAADKFEVLSCMRVCKSLLTKLPLNLESSLLYLDLPSCLSNAEVVQPLTDAAKQFFIANYGKFDKNLDKIMEFPLEAVEAIMSNSALEVRDEDTLFDFALKWSASHYPKLEDQKKILSTRLGRYIRFPYMSPANLSEVLSCNKFDSDYAQKVVADALLFKANTPHHHRYTPKVPTTTFKNHHCPFVRRRYSSRLIKVVKLDHPRPEVAIYLDVTKHELKRLGWFRSESFDSCGEAFHLSIRRKKMDDGSFNFCLSLVMHPKKTVTVSVDYKVSARSRFGGDFLLLKKSSGKFNGGDFLRLYRCPWLDLMAGRELDFIEGTLYFKVDLRIKL